MTKENTKKTPIVAPHRQPDFRGYTIGELRQQRLLTQIRKEFIKEKLLNDAHTLTNFKAMTGGNNSKMTNVLALAGKGMRLMSYADFFAVGLALFRSGQKVYSLFKHK